MLNQLYPDGDALFFKCPTTVTRGMPVLIGTLAAVAIDDYNSALGGTAFVLKGVYSLTVVAASTQSPVSGEQLNPGDELFASGSFDATTNVTTALTIDKTRGNTPFGNFVPNDGSHVASGATSTTAPVRLKYNGSGPYAS